MKNQDQILLERAYYKLYEQEQPAQQLDAKVQQQLQKSIEQLVQAVTANPQDENLINTLKQLSQTEDPQKQAQILKAAESTAKQSEQQVQEQLNLPQFHSAKAALGALKDPNTSYGAEKRKSQVASLRKIIGRSLAELDRDLKALRYDPAKHPEVDKVLTDVRNTVGGEGIEKVDTAFDRAVHGAGKFATGAVRNAAVFAAISGSLGAAGVANPYAAKAISGAATSVLRDLSKGQLNKGSIKRAAIGAGIGAVIQGASDLIGGAGGAAGAAGAAGEVGDAVDPSPEPTLGDYEARDIAASDPGEPFPADPEQSLDDYKAADIAASDPGEPFPAEPEQSLDDYKAADIAASDPGEPFPADPEPSLDDYEARDIAASDPGEPFPSSEPTLGDYEARDIAASDPGEPFIPDVKPVPDSAVPDGTSWTPDVTNMDDYDKEFLEITGMSPEEMQALDASITDEEVRDLVVKPAKRFTMDIMNMKDQLKALPAGSEQYIEMERRIADYQKILQGVTQSAKKELEGLNI